MRFEKVTKINELEYREPLQTRIMSEVEFKPGEIIICYNDDGSLYGSFGAVYATQIDPSKQITYLKGEMS